MGEEFGVVEPSWKARVCGKIDVRIIASVKAFLVMAGTYTFPSLYCLSNDNI